MALRSSVARCAWRGHGCGEARQRHTYRTWRRAYEDEQGGEAPIDASSSKRSKTREERGVVGSRIDDIEQGQPKVWPSVRLPAIPPFFGLPVGYVVMLCWSFLVPALVVFFWNNPTLQVPALLR